MSQSSYFLTKTLWIFWNDCNYFCPEMWCLKFLRPLCVILKLKEKQKVDLKQFGKSSNFQGCSLWERAFLEKRFCWYVAWARSFLEINTTLWFFKPNFWRFFSENIYSHWLRLPIYHLTKSLSRNKRTKIAVRLLCLLRLRFWWSRW